MNTSTNSYASVIRGMWFQLKSLAKTTFFLQNAILAPVCFALMKIVAYYGFSHDCTNFLNNIWVDSSIAGLWSATTTAVGIIGYQRYLGTLQYLTLSVISPAAVFLPIVGSAALLGCIGMPLAIITVVVFCHGFFMITFTQLVGYLLSMLACVASAALLSGIFVLCRKATVYEGLILIPVWMLCGIVIPVESMPLPARVIAFIHPLTSAVWVAHAQSFNATTVLAIVLCVVLSSVLLVIAGFMLRHAIRLATLNGSLNII